MISGGQLANATVKIPQDLREDLQWNTNSTLPDGTKQHTVMIKSLGSNHTGGQRVDRFLIR